MPHIPFGHGRRLPAWAMQLALAVVACALALGGAALLADHQWMGGTVLFGLAVLAALTAAVLRRPSTGRRS